MSTKIYIATPCYDAMVTMQYTMSLLNLTVFLNQRRIEFLVDFIGNESLITRARNNFLGRFIQSDCTHLLFIDSDIEFQPQAVLDLLLFDKDVACCTYPKKGYNWNKCMHSMQTESNSKESLESRGLDFAYNPLYDKYNKVIKDADFIKVIHAATGFMMIKKEIATRLCEKHSELIIIIDDLSNLHKKTYGLFCCMIKDSQYLSEDYSFCDRVNAIGGEVWVNVSHNLKHIGKYSFNSDIKNRESYGRSVAEKVFYK